MIKFFIVAALAASGSAAFAQDRSTTALPSTAALAPVTTPAVVPSPVSGRIIMFRPSSIMGMGLACPIRYRGQELVELGRGKFAEWVVPAGSYILGNKTASVEVNVVAGHSKFIRCQIKPGFMTGRADLQIVDQESFAEHQADYEQKQIVEPTIVASIH